MNSENIKLEKSWHKHLSGEFDQDYMLKLKKFLNSEYEKKKLIFPKGSEYFNAFNACPFEKVKVVIIGQDPYHGPDQAHGLCFSVKKGVRVPPSLRNIYKELKSDLNIEPPEHGAFLLLAVPNTGDELQGIKKGIMELADVIAVNKADVDPKAADLAKIQMESALTMVTSSSLWSPRVLTNNALSKDSVEMVWSVLQEYLSSIRANGDLEKLREKQNLIWLKEKVQTLMMDSIKSSESYVMLMQQAQLKVQKKSQHVVEAASELVGEWMKI